jgi:nucleotide-binding universal stress UspA family protein
MTERILNSVVFPTDFSDEGLVAFAHALRIGVANQSLLHLLHIGAGDEKHNWALFPHVRKTLARWGMLEEGASETELATKLGVRVKKAHVKAHNPVEGIVSYLEVNECDLLVCETHARTYWQRLFQASVSEAAARLSQVPTLFIRDGQSGFVNPETGATGLRLVLIPIDENVSPMPAWRWLSQFGAPFNPSCQFRLMHVGGATPKTDDALPPVDLRRGPIIDTIVAYAKEIDADLIAMPTCGGGTTERVIHTADQPVLAIPNRNL